MRMTYHEAGLAVLAFVLGRPVQCGSILPDRDHDGICEFGKGVYRPTEDWLEREILIALGGIAAEVRFTGIYSWDGAPRSTVCASIGCAAGRRAPTGEAPTPFVSQGQTPSFERGMLAGGGTHRSGVASSSGNQRSN